MDTRQAVSTSRSASARLAIVAALASSALMAVATTAHAGDIMVRARVLQMDPANESYGPHPALADNAVSVSSRLLWELDASYFMTPNWAVEVIATTPPKHTVSTGGARLGTVRHLPPTVTLQYHLAPTNASVRPYIGFGLNYTRFSAVDLDAGPALGSSTPVPLKLKNNSWGTAVQIGADFPINEKLSVNVDFKKIDIGTKVSLADGTYLGTVKINPVLFGAGIGYKF